MESHYISKRKVCPGWAADLSCRTQGWTIMYDCLSVHCSPPRGLTPKSSPLRPVIKSLDPETPLSGLKSAFPDLGSAFPSLNSTLLEMKSSLSHLKSCNGSPLCSYQTSSPQHLKQSNGYRWQCAILGWLVLQFLRLGQRPRIGQWPMIPYWAFFFINFACCSIRNLH